MGQIQGVFGALVREEGHNHSWCCMRKGKKEKKDWGRARKKIEDRTSIRGEEELKDA